MTTPHSEHPPPSLARVLDPEAARERLEERKARFEQMTAQTQAMAERMQQLSATVTDPNGIVAVRVDSTGNLTGIELSARMHRTSPEAVSRTIMETIAEARNRIVEQTQEVVAETVGADSETGRAVTASLQERLASDTEGEWQ